MSYPPFAYIVTLTGNWFSLVKDVMVHLLQDFHVRKLLDMVMSNASFVANAAIKLVDLFTTVKEKDNVLAYSLTLEPEKGFVGYTQNLPIQWYEFEEVPLLYNYFSTNEEPAFDITEFYIQSLDAVRSFSNVVNSKSLLPPFSAYAMLIGDAHFLTFDGRLFSATGECSYLLTSDFGNDRFSIVGNYRNKKRISINVLVDDSSIEIFRDGRVVIDKLRVELPKLFGSSYLKHEQNRIILYNKKGFVLNCNLVHHICTIKLSGWYFGRNGGLLGVYDNEASNDFMLPNRTIIQDVAPFIESWQIKDQCKDDVISNQESTISKWDIGNCYKHLGDHGSTLRPCFGVIDPKPYYEVCLRENNRNNTSPLKGICLASAAYIEQCRLSRIDVGQPLDCVHCEMPDGVVKGGMYRDYQRVKDKSADIMFIVDQKQCIKDLDWGLLVPKVEASLAADGFLHNRYALIGFGGQYELNDPHIFTTNNKLFTRPERIISTFDK